MKHDDFMQLPTPQIARLVHEQGVQTCAFPINGTRRWFLLEQPNLTTDFLEANLQAHLHIYRLFFEHGIQTLMTPVFGPDLLQRGPEYLALTIRGLHALASHPDYVAFYQACDVQVRFYGDYLDYLPRDQYADLIAALEDIQQQTQNHSTHRLLFGLFAHDATETLARLSVAHYQQHGSTPSKGDLIQAYYGVPLAPLSFFLGFDKFTMFDVPLVTTGAEDLYFTVSPSLYLTETQLRAILYDHMFTRRLQERDYNDLSAYDTAMMRDFYEANMESVIGVGRRQQHGNYWYPLPQVRLTSEFDDESVTQAQL